MMEEHQGVEPNEIRAEEYKPTAEERKALGLVKKLFRKSKGARKDYDCNWLKYYQFYRGKQWDTARPSYRHSDVVNLVFQNIQSMLPLLTDAKPRFEFMPQEPQDRPVAEVLNEVARADWDKYNWSEEQYEVLMNGHIYGTGLSEMFFDPDKLHGLGAICYESKETMYFYPDPEAHNVDKHCEYVIYIEPRDIDKLKAENPKFAKFLKADFHDVLDGEKNDLGSDIRIKTPVDDNNTLVDGGSNQELDRKNAALVITAHILDNAVFEEERTNEDGTKEFVTKKKYPKGRKIILASGVVLEDGESDMDHGEIPYQKWVNYHLPDEFWGMGEVEQLIGPQKTFNKLVSFTMDTLTLMGAPIWVVDSTSGVDTDNLINRPGLVVEKEPGTEVRRESGVQLQSWVMQMIDRYKEYFDQVAGSQDVTRGVAAGGVTAASAIEELQNAAQTRVRQKSRNLDMYLQKVGQHYKSLVFQHYTHPRIFRLTSAEGIDGWFKMHMEKDEEGKRSMMVQRFDNNGTVRLDPNGNEVSKYQIYADIDVRVATGTSLAFNRSRRKSELFELFDRGLIDPEEVLKGLDFPNHEAVLQRVQEQQAAAAEAAPPA
jgi:hypothetical protein